MLENIKLYLAAALIVAALVFATWYTLHERGVGKAEVEAANARTLVAAAAFNQRIEQLTQEQSDSGFQIYKQIVALPAVGDVGVVCRRASPEPVPAAPASPGVPAALGVQADSGAVAFDPSGELLTTGRVADAEIDALVIENQALRAMIQSIHDHNGKR